MTVKELIKMLEKVSGDLDVFYPFQQDGGTDYYELDAYEVYVGIPGDLNEAALIIGEDGEWKS